MNGPSIKVDGPFMTRNGVEYRLEKSPYMYEINGIKIFFSSKSHLNKFISFMPLYVLEMMDKFKERYGFNCYFETLFILMAYARIETRGFYIEYEGRCFNCQDQLALGGGTMIL